MFLPVIMAGGAGIRLWPLSNPLHPKPFHALTGERSLLQETVARLDGLPSKSPLVVCNEEHRFVAARQLRGIGRDDATLVLEPFGRNTAPALALAALVATREGDDPTMLALPADHVVRDMAAFHAAIATAAVTGPMPIFSRSTFAGD